MQVNGNVGRVGFEPTGGVLRGDPAIHRTGPYFCYWIALDFMKLGYVIPIPLSPFDE